MVYVVGIVGFLGGFFAGQLLLMQVLRNRSTEELMTNKNLRWQYGIINWVIAALGAYSFVLLYRHYIGY